MSGTANVWGGDQDEGGTCYGEDISQNELPKRQEDPLPERSSPNREVYNAYGREVV